MENPFKFIFDQSDPNVNQELRKRIALAMMGQKRAFPKTVGEGLSSIGDSIGDALIGKNLERQDAASRAAAGKEYDAALAAASPPAPSTRSFAPTSTEEGGETSSTPAPVPGSFEVEPGVGDGGYNILDAQARLGFKPTPGYMQDTIAAKEPNVDMQAYLGSLSGDEAPKGARDVSPTGAAGPFQFTKGTGRDYGIPGDKRFDPAASTDAVRAFTADNAAAFQKANGRPPTFQELAVMHQQGRQGGINLLAGRGTEPGNLAVNNIPAGATPQQAVGKINRFYGMPNETAQVSPRDAVAAQLAARQQPGGGASALAPTGPAAAPGGLPPEILTGRSAPTIPGAIPPAPGGFTPATPPPSAQPDPRLAQAQIPGAPPANPIRAMPTQAADPGYVTPKPGQLTPPPILEPNDRERNLARKIVTTPNEYTKQMLGGLYQEEVKKREIKQGQLNEAHKNQEIANRALELQHHKDMADQAKRISEEAERQQKLKAGPHTTVDGRLMIPDPNKPLGSPWIDVTAPMPGAKDGEGPPQLRKPLTEQIGRAHV